MIHSIKFQAPVFPRDDVNRAQEDEASDTHFLRLLSVTMHSTSSKRQFVHGAPCSTTLQRTFRARQHWQAFDALLLTARKPALLFPLGLLRFWPATGDGEVVVVSAIM